MIVPEEIDVLIRVVKKITQIERGKKAYKPETMPHEISNVFFEQQGIKEVIRILEGMRDGHIKPKDILEEN